MSTKLKIDNDLLVEEFFEDVQLIGVVSPLKHYQFAWSVNNSLGFNFRINNDLEIQLKRKNRNYFFSVSEYLVPRTSLTHYLYCNHFDGEFLLPEFKNLDFLWLLKGPECHKENLIDLVQSVKHISGIQLVSEMTLDKIKNKSHLIL